MPQDPNLYGQRPTKKQKKEIPLSSSLTFTSQLTSLLSTPSTSSSPSASASPGRARPSKTKDDIFNVRAKRKATSSSKPNHDDERPSLALKDPRGTEDEKHDLARTRRKMEEKARLYAAMKRGDYIAPENEAAPLVDFDRKWAEKHPTSSSPSHPDHISSSGSDNDSDSDGGEEIVEYKDEFGRTRTGTRASLSRHQRSAARSALGAAELERMAARPIKAPERLIYGDAIQTSAFDPSLSTTEAMAALSSKRDRSPTPPPDAHFDGGAEIRTKGVGFYQFSKDEGVRRQEMESLERERGETVRVREERKGERERRKREIEERRRRIGRVRAERMAERFLEGLAGEMGTVVPSSAAGTGFTHRSAGA
ncbi:hypothetical protein F5B20DRAFT_571796 [Whalleya microplaca]|nr:hypothetical protein F5B20DRAFT_571796 [Whalleya microplaca]